MTLFGVGLAILAAACYRTRMSRVALFWAAFVLTRPLGATVGDFFDKPVAQGGLAISPPLASGILTVAIIILVFLIPRRPGRHPATAERILEG
jgi:uncharacterized membrane-anchored protein